MPRRLASYGLLALAAVAATTGFVAHRVLDRPGETALALVPADAKGVVVLDIVPAPDQVLAFQSIRETISKATGGGSTDLAAILAKEMHDPKLSPLAAQIDRSVDAVWLAPPKPKEGMQDADVAIIVALKDPAAFAAALAKAGKPFQYGGTKFVQVAFGAGTKPQTMAVAVHEDYAILSDKAWCVDRIGRVIRGVAPAIGTNAAFMAAKAQALPSANLLVMVSPEVIRGKEWGVASMAIREKGVDMAISGQSDDPTVAKIGAFKPLDKGLLDALPKGAYGFFAASQIGPALELFGDTLDKPAEEMKKNTQVDLRKDVVPALGGNTVVAFYPGQANNTGLDLLVTMDDANGADPAALARKLEAVVEEQIEKDGKTPVGTWKADLTIPGAEASRLGDEVTREIQEELQKAEKAFARPMTLSKGKTIAWARVGKSVVFASSEDLLTRAVAARQSPSAASGLSGDAMITTNPAMTLDGQIAYVTSGARIAEGLRNTLDPSHMKLADATMYRKMLSLYESSPEPSSVRMGVEPGGQYHMTMSSAIDWSKLPAFFEK